MHASVHEIRQRLLALLGRAFLAVLLFILLIFLTALGYFLSSNFSPVQRFVPQALRGYYLGHGSWEGVESVFTLDNELHTGWMILLDEEQRLILDRRPNSTLKSGTHYEIQPHDLAMDMVVDGRKVGILILPSLSLAARFELARGILIPIGFISIILALFAFVVAIQLMRRFVNPLADVIFAARAMAAGNLQTRIPSKGPQDLRSLSENFNEMAASLERYDRERRAMLADVAHELRTPLSIVRGRLEGIVDGIYTQDGSQVSLALQQIYVLERLVEDLRLLTLAETRQLPFDQARLDVGELLHRTLEMFSAEADEKNISLSFEERAGDLTLTGDAQRLEQVFGNLIGNAIRYVPEGGRVWVTASEAPQGLRVTINDNGAGLPQEDLPFIFERFWRKDKSRSRLSGGTGLGLAIAKQLVEAQGGTIEARNLPESGLQVEIRLERKAAPEARPTSLPAGMA